MGGARRVTFPYTPPPPPTPRHPLPISVHSSSEAPPHPPPPVPGESGFWVGARALDASPLDSPLRERSLGLLTQWHYLSSSLGYCSGEHFLSLREHFLSLASGSTSCPRLPQRPAEGFRKKCRPGPPALARLLPPPPRRASVGGFLGNCTMLVCRRSESRSWTGRKVYMCSHSALIPPVS